MRGPRHEHAEQEMRVCVWAPLGGERCGEVTGGERREGQADAHAGVWALSKNVPARLSCVVRVCPIARYARYVTDCQFSVSLQA